MKPRTGALAGAALIGFASPALAGEGWYAGVGGGWSTPSNVGYSVATSNNVFPVSSGEIKLKSGTRYLANLGYKWAFGLRLEAEGSYAAYDLNGLMQLQPAPNNLPISGRAKIWTGLMNLAYDIPLAPRLAATMGGGVGLADFNPGTSYANTQARIALQALAALSYSITPQLDLQLEYRYAGFSNGDEDYNPGQVKLNGLTSQSVMVSLRFYLQGIDFGL